MVAPLSRAATRSRFSSDSQACFSVPLSYAFCRSRNSSKEKRGGQPLLRTISMPGRILQQPSTSKCHIARERLYPRTSHLRPLGMSATLSVWVRIPRLLRLFLRIAYIRPPTGKGVPTLRLGVAALPRIVAVLPLVEPKHVAASLRHSPSRICWRRFSRFLVESVEISRPCAISGTSWFGLNIFISKLQ